MQATIQKWGNSQGIRIPKAILELSNIKENEQVQLVAEENAIIIKKVAKKREHIPLSKRLEGWQGKPYELTEEDEQWLNAKPVGNEIC